MAQLVARYLGVVEAASSSLVTQTKKEIRKNLLFSYFFAIIHGLLALLSAFFVSILMIPKVFFWRKF